jgi:hypothetical protein
LQTTIYDWQLLPIAKLADSPYTACFTLYGDRQGIQDDSVRRDLEENGGSVVAYHPALKDTLLGLRLMQLDMLIGSEDAADLPKLKNQYLLGDGERAPLLVSNRRAANIS